MAQAGGVITRVIGVGSELRGDDAAGLLAARLVRDAAPAGVDVRESDGEIGMLLQLMAGIDRLLLVDAAADGHPPGTVRRLGPAGARMSATATTHRLGPAEALGLAAALGELPPVVGLYTISARSFEGAGVTSAVASGARAAAAAILRELAGDP